MILDHPPPEFRVILNHKVLREFPSHVKWIVCIGDLCDIEHEHEEGRLQIYDRKELVGEYLDGEWSGAGSMFCAYTQGYQDKSCHACTTQEQPCGDPNCHGCVWLSRVLASQA